MQLDESIQSMEKGEKRSGDERKAIEDAICQLNSHISDVASELPPVTHRLGRSIIV